MWLAWPTDAMTRKVQGKAYFKYLEFDTISPTGNAFSRGYQRRAGEAAWDGPAPSYPTRRNTAADELGRRTQQQRNQARRSSLQQTNAGDLEAEKQRLAQELAALHDQHKHPEDPNVAKLKSVFDNDEVAVAQHDLALVSDRLHEVEEKKKSTMALLDEAKARVRTLTKRQAMLKGSDIARRLGKEEHEMATEHEKREKHLKFLRDRNAMQELKLQNLLAKQTLVGAACDEASPGETEGNSEDTQTATEPEEAAAEEEKVIVDPKGD